MSPDLGLTLGTIALILVSAFFVAAEYSLVSVRRSQIEGLAKKGNRSAQALVHALDQLRTYVAGVQVAITMLGMIMGLVAEPFVSDLIRRGLGQVVAPESLTRFSTVISAVSLILITYVTVVFGELVPKYLALMRTEQIALWTIRPLGLMIRILKPLVWLVQRSGTAVSRWFGVDSETMGDENVSREELSLLIRSGGSSGSLEKKQAEILTRALRLDNLAARDIMIHRVDIKWLDADLTRDALLTELRRLPYNRLPVCNGDIDDLVGVVYIYDIVRSLDNDPFDLREICRPPVAVPENLTLDKIVETMRAERTQMLIVMDEYGGTSGLLTLEDVVEEVFGELEDSLELERPPIEVRPGGRVTARAEIRVDELADFLGIELEDPSTESLATVVINELEQVPRVGDRVEFELGTLRVENMARRRITRVSIQLREPIQSR